MVKLMKSEIVKLSILTFLAGVFCKIYDDFNDNDLYTTSDFLHGFSKYKLNINEFLKMIHIILLIFVSSTYIYPFLFFWLMNICQYSIDQSGYENVYEFTGLIVACIWSIFLLLTNYQSVVDNIKYILLFVSLSLGVSYTFEFATKNIEFGYKKLASRGFISISAIIIVWLNSLYMIIPDEFIFYSWYGIGYCITSCIFQIYLIINNKSIVNKSKSKIDDIAMDTIIEPESIDEEIGDDDCSSHTDNIKK